MAAGAPVADVVLLATGGTIASRASGGAGAAPADAAGVLMAAAGVDDVLVEAVDVLRAPGAQLTLADVERVARAVLDAAAGARRGVVVTMGTDVIEEVALLCDLVHAGDAPVVFTGAIRPASSPGADGPANLADAVRAAASEEARGCGVLVAFGGELHAARGVAKVDSVSTLAFGSPGSGPIGHVRERDVVVTRRPVRRPAIALGTLEADVRIHTVTAGEPPAALRALAAGADAVVVAAMGAGHVPPGTLAVLRELEVPVAATSRCHAPTLLKTTYGFEGAEGDLRAVAVPGDPLTPVGVRMALVAGLAAGLDRAGLTALLARG